MAERRWIETRRYGTVLAAAAMLAATLACGRSGEDEAAARSEAPAAGAEAPSPVAEYLAFATTLEEGGGRSAEQTIAEGLRRLAAALGGLGLLGSEATIDLRIAAEHVVLNPTATDNVETIRTALITAADAIATRQGADAGLRAIAERLSTSQPLVEQQDTMREFFQASAGALEQIAPPA